MSCVGRSTWQTAWPSCAPPPRVWSCSILDLDPTALRRAVIDVLMINAAVHTAAVTNLEEEAFHDAMEGLGMLMSLRDLARSPRCGAPAGRFGSVGIAQFAKRVDIVRYEEPGCDKRVAPHPN